MSRDVRWCHTLNTHATHEYGPGILCPGVTPEYEQRLLNAAIRINQEVEQYRPRFTVENLAEPVDSIRQYWTEGDGAKPLDPVERVLAAQRALRAAQTDAEKLRAMGECEEAVAAKDAADLDEANSQPPYARLHWRHFAYPVAIGAGAALTEAAVDHHGFTWWRWLLAWAFALLLPKFFAWVVRTFKSDSERADAAAEPEPDYEKLSSAERSYIAYQLSLAAGIEPDGLWEPKIGEVVRVTDEKRAPVLVRLTNISLTVSPPRWVGYARHGERVSLRLSDMRPATKYEMEDWRRR